MPPAIPDKVPCESIHAFEQELDALRDALSYQETEETWERIARALTRFGAVVKGGGYKFEKELINGMKASSKPITSSMNSERTRLSAAALECISIIAPRIGLAFDSLVPLFVPHILRLATRSNKVYVTRSQTTLGLILGYCHIPSIIPHLLVACKESKIVTGRAVALEGVLRCLNKWDWAQRDIKAKVGDVEEIIRITGRDKDAGIRQTSRKVFEAYKILFPERLEEFTGPLTPVMRKYLDIKPLPHGQNPIQRVRQQSAAEKPRKVPTKPDLAASTSSAPSSTSDEARTNLGAHARSASSNAVIGTSSGKSNSKAPDAAADPRSMPPPPTIPTHARNVSRPQAPSRSGHRQEGNTRYERERVLSTTSTHSTQSAPANPHSTHGHRPPMRLATSQTQSSRTNPVVAGASGKARRVRKEIPVEPHPANLPDSLATAHKAPVRTATNKGPARQVAQGAPSNALGVTFPMSDITGARKGAQRVPKPVPPPVVSAPTTPPKVERPATVMGIISKREVKPSIFRRGVAGAPGVGPKESEKKQEGFPPRRGGGLSQPTLSQLSRQKAHTSVHGAASHGPKPRAPVAANRPVWGAGAVKAGKALPVLRGQVLKGQGRTDAAGAQAPKLPENAQAAPAMVPLPVSPGREKEIVPQLVSLPASPRAETSSSKQMEEHHQEIEAAEDAPATVEVYEIKEGVVPVETTVADEIVDDLQDHEQEVHAESGEPATSVQEETPIADVVSPEIARTPSPPRPSTPPFPPTDGESEEDELEDIEFTSGEVYAPGGAPIKTPRKVAVLPERSPLGEVVLNA